MTKTRVDPKKSARLKTSLFETVLLSVQKYIPNLTPIWSESLSILIGGGPQKKRQHAMMLCDLVCGSGLRHRIANEQIPYAQHSNSAGSGAAVQRECVRERSERERETECEQRLGRLFCPRSFF